MDSSKIKLSLAKEMQSLPPLAAQFWIWLSTFILSRISRGTFFSTNGGEKEKEREKEEKKGEGKKGGEKGGERGGERNIGKFKQLYQCFNRNCNYRQPCWGCFGLFGPHQCSEAIPPPPPPPFPITDSPYDLYLVKV